MTGRGSAVTRGLITGVATFVGGVAHAPPFVISDVDVALSIAYPVVGAELVLIAWIRKRYQQVSLRQSLIQVTLGGALVAAVGIALGHA
jgi:erythrin-vacuolar iron transport family protein